MRETVTDALQGGALEEGDVAEIARRKVKGEPLIFIFRDGLLFEVGP